MSRAEIYELKKKLARIKRSRCYICHRPFGKGFAFHHVYYDGFEPDYRNTDLYWNYVSKQITNTPRQFYLLCKPHHYLIDRYLKRMGNDKFRRVVVVRRESRRYSK